MSILLHGCTTWTLTKRMEKRPGSNYTKAGRPARTYIQQLCAGTGYSLEDLMGATDDRNGWRERVKEIRTGNVTWWWGVWFSDNILPLIKMTNRNITQRGTQTKSLGVMRGRWSLDSQHWQTCECWLFFFQVHERRSWQL